jgi:hypothetical protein
MCHHEGLDCMHSHTPTPPQPHTHICIFCLVVGPLVSPPQLVTQPCCSVLLLLLLFVIVVIIFVLLQLQLLLQVLRLLGNCRGAGR